MSVGDTTITVNHGSECPGTTTSCRARRQGGGDLGRQRLDCGRRSGGRRQPDRHCRLSLQARWQHKFEAAKSQEDRRWTEKVTASERDRVEMTRRRDELLEIYIRYQLAADRIENAVRELADVSRPVRPDAATAQAGEPAAGGSDPQVNHLRKERLAELYEIKRDAYEIAQNEYDKACEIVKLIAPLQTVEVILRQRQLFNRFVREAFDGRYDHPMSYPAIVEAADPVLGAMRSDLHPPPSG